MKQKFDPKSTNFIVKKLIRKRFERVRFHGDDEIFMPFCKQGHKNLLDEWTTDKDFADTTADNHSTSTRHQVTVKRKFV